jgi:hypothetical protein
MTNLELCGRLRCVQVIYLPLVEALPATAVSFSGKGMAANAVGLAGKKIGDNFGDK